MKKYKLANKARKKAVAKAKTEAYHDSLTGDERWKKP